MNTRKWSLTLVFAAGLCTLRAAPEIVLAPTNSARHLPIIGHGKLTGSESTSTNGRKAEPLPPLPTGVAELKFSDFFQHPAGPFGLDYTDKLCALAGKRVRILGYMVRQDQPARDAFMLAPMPLALHEEEYGFCDDLPASVVRVSPAPGSPEIRFTPGLLLLTGTLAIGNRQEADGRVSTVRLLLDPAPPGTNSPITTSLRANTTAEAKP